MSKAEGLHGDWQHMTGDEVEAAQDTALAVGGEAAVELEATAPAVAVDGFEVTSVETLEPISEASRDALRPPDVHGVGLHHPLKPGPNGQMITGSNGV